ncbi:MAG: glutaredoxin 3 [Proteobacteria bacterium]|nr:glutaredoxin 3 [Pseudomonadota bacterium]MCP4921871.1 glutaredoxin 3 [Pseudomonadota bacterium]
MTPVRIYTAVPCGYCSAAKGFFKDNDIAYEEIDLTGDRDARMDLIQKTGQRTVPQIFIGDTHVGGYTDLIALARSGGLQPLLHPTAETAP